ncbi:Protein of unknown function [Propionibacterium freudenreichii]|nr:Protein of unknown function [Propionibacterium freudenreichii]
MSHGALPLLLEGPFIEATPRML